MMLAIAELTLLYLLATNVKIDCNHCLWTQHAVPLNTCFNQYLEVDASSTLRSYQFVCNGVNDGSIFKIDYSDNTCSGTPKRTQILYNLFASGCYNNNGIMCSSTASVLLSSIHILANNSAEIRYITNKCMLISSAAFNISKLTQCTDDSIIEWIFSDIGCTSFQSVTTYSNGDYYPNDNSVLQNIIDCPLCNLNTKYDVFTTQTNLDVNYIVIHEDVYHFPQPIDVCNRFVFDGNNASYKYSCYFSEFGTVQIHKTIWKNDSYCDGLYDEYQEIDSALYLDFNCLNYNDIEMDTNQIRIQPSFVHITRFTNVYDTNAGLCAPNISTPWIQIAYITNTCIQQSNNTWIIIEAHVSFIAIHYYTDDECSDAEPQCLQLWKSNDCNIYNHNYFEIINDHFGGTREPIMLTTDFLPTTTATNPFDVELSIDAKHTDSNYINLHNYKEPMNVCNEYVESDSKSSYKYVCSKGANSAKYKKRKWKNKHRCDVDGDDYDEEDDIDPTIYSFQASCDYAQDLTVQYCKINCFQNSRRWEQKSVILNHCIQINNGQNSIYIECLHGYTITYYYYNNDCTHFNHKEYWYGTYCESRYSKYLLKCDSDYYKPTPSPTYAYTLQPTDSPSMRPTDPPTIKPTDPPTTAIPTTDIPTLAPIIDPTTLIPTNTLIPTAHTTIAPSIFPSLQPTFAPTINPSVDPTLSPSPNPTVNPTASRTTAIPTSSPTVNPTSSTTTAIPTSNPTVNPIASPTTIITAIPTSNPTATAISTSNPTTIPTINPTANPSDSTTTNPTARIPTQTTMSPTAFPTFQPTFTPTTNPAENPTLETLLPTISPIVETVAPTIDPSITPTTNPLPTAETLSPTADPTESPNIETLSPTTNPSDVPSVSPTAETLAPSTDPTEHPTINPSPEPTPIPISITPTTEAPTPIPTSLVPTTEAPNQQPATTVPTTEQPTISPIMQPTFPSQEPSVSPTARSCGIETYQSYNQTNASYWLSNDIFTAKYIEFVEQAFFLTYENLTGHSMHYEDREKWNNRTWRFAGMINFQTCMLFSIKNDDPDVPADCPFVSDPDPGNAQYVLAVTFCVVADQNEDDFAQYLQYNISSDPRFSEVFDFYINPIIDANTPCCLTRRRRLRSNKESALYTHITIKTYSIDATHWKVLNELRMKYQGIFINKPAVIGDIAILLWIIFGLMSISALMCWCVRRQCLYKRDTSYALFL